MQPTQNRYSAPGTSLMCLTPSGSPHSARLEKPRPQGLEFVSRLRKKALSSGGNLLCIRTWLRRAPTILRMCSISTGQSFWQAPQVVQVQISPSVKVAGTSSARSSRFFATSALPPASRAFSMLKTIILGERGLSLAKAGQASWQRPHSMQAKASRLSFQVKSGSFSRPKTSDFSRSRGASSPLGVDRRRKTLNGPANMCRYLEWGT